MRTARNNGVRLLIAEHGSDWQHWRGGAGLPGAEIVETRQQAGEDASAFAVRVRSRVAELERRGHRVAEGVLCGSGRADRETLAARSLVIRSVAATMARRGSGRIVLDSHRTDRFSMRALATTVSGMVRGTGVEIRSAADEPAYDEVA